MKVEIEDEQIPLLLFILNHNKFQQILKAMLNQKLSKTLLSQYGEQLEELSKIEEFRISNAVNRFTILQVCIFIIRKQLVELKGSCSHSVKDYHNVHLQEMIRRKLQIENASLETRKSFWVQLTEIYKRPHFYHDLKQLNLGQDFLTVIEKDILRTQKDEDVREKSREVLQLFSHYNPYVGYCQGMNTIIAFLISRGFTCEQSFFIFKRVTEELLPCDYYSNMDNVMAYSRIFYELLNITHPQIYVHLKKISQEMENTYALMVSFVLQWFVCLFCNDNINENITEVIWDFFQIDGMVVLLKAALAYFDLLKDDILKCTDFESYSLMQKEKIKSIRDAQHVRKRIMETFISPKLLFLLKQKLIQPNEDENRLQKKSTLAYRKTCHRSLNVCFQVLEDNINQNKSYDIFVFKPKAPINIIPNYLDRLNKQYFNNERQKQKVDSLIIGRIPHICRNSSDTLTEGSMSDKNVTETELQTTPKKSLTSTPKSLKTPSKESEKKIREKVCQKITEMAETKRGFTRSESVIFMEEMVKNVSISNLLQLYDIDELFQ